MIKVKFNWKKKKKSGCKQTDLWLAFSYIRCHLLHWILIGFNRKKVTKSRTGSGSTSYYHRTLWDRVDLQLPTLSSFIMLLISPPTGNQSFDDHYPQTPVTTLSPLGHIKDKIGGPACEALTYLFSLYSHRGHQHNSATNKLKSLLMSEPITSKLCRNRDEQSLFSSLSKRKYNPFS